jgi:uncharacterized protein (UPF0332 family)
MTLAEEYTDNSQRFLEHAEEALHDGDLLQASEKLWGAAAQAVKAVAQRKGWEHNSHRLLFRAVSRLAEENDDARLRTLFHIANSLHANFYENWMTKEYIEEGQEEIKEFVNRLERLS